MALLLGAAEAWAQPAPEPAGGNISCQLCSSPDTGSLDAPSRPLQIEIESGLDFSRLAVGPNGGAVSIEPQSSDRRISGDIIDLGGLPVMGTVRLYGEPGRRVRIIMPDRIELTSNHGGRLDLSNIRTDLSPAPMLGPDGSLVFSFGGKLEVKGPVSGDFRGRIAIEADYE